jgi:anti-anti-sigma factor
MWKLIEKTEILVVVALAGPLDSSTMPVVEMELTGLVHAGHRYVVLDFTEVTLLASDGLKLLLRLETLCRKSEGSLTLAAMPEPARRVLELAGFAPHFHAYADVIAARAALEG